MIKGVFNACLSTLDKSNLTNNTDKNWYRGLRISGGNCVCVCVHLFVCMCHCHCAYSIRMTTIRCSNTKAVAMTAQYMHHKRSEHGCVPRTN